MSDFFNSVMENMDNCFYENVIIFEKLSSEERITPKNKKFSSNEISEENSNDLESINHLKNKLTIIEQDLYDALESKIGLVEKINLMEEEIKTLKKENMQLKGVFSEIKSDRKKKKSNACHFFEESYNYLLKQFKETKKDNLNLRKEIERINEIAIEIHMEKEKTIEQLKVEWSEIEENLIKNHEKEIKVLKEKIEEFKSIEKMKKIEEKHQLENIYLREKIMELNEELDSSEKKKNKKLSDIEHEINERIDHRYKELDNHFKQAEDELLRTMSCRYSFQFDNDLITEADDRKKVKELEKKLANLQNHYECDLINFKKQIEEINENSEIKTNKLQKYYETKIVNIENDWINKIALKNENILDLERKNNNLSKNITQLEEELKHEKEKNLKLKENIANLEKSKEELEIIAIEYNKNLEEKKTFLKQNFQKDLNFFDENSDYLIKKKLARSKFKKLNSMSTNYQNVDTKNNQIVPDFINKIAKMRTLTNELDEIENLNFRKLKEDKEKFMEFGIKIESEEQMLKEDDKNYQKNKIDKEKEKDLHQRSKTQLKLPQAHKRIKSDKPQRRSPRSATSPKKRPFNLINEEINENNENNEENLGDSIIVQETTFDAIWSEFKPTTKVNAYIAYIKNCILEFKKMCYDYEDNSNLSPKEKSQVALIHFESVYLKLVRFAKKLHEHHKKILYGLLQKTIGKLDSHVLEIINHFNLIDVRVKDYEFNSEGFVEYNIYLEDKVVEKTWNFTIRYANLNDFHKSLRSKLPKNLIPHLPPFPPKKWINNKDPSFLQTRKKDIEKYLKTLITNEVSIKIIDYSNIKNLFSLMIDKKLQISLNDYINNNFSTFQIVLNDAKQNLKTFDFNKLSTNNIYTGITEVIQEFPSVIFQLEQKAKLVENDMNVLEKNEILEMMKYDDDKNKLLNRTSMVNSILNFSKIVHTFPSENGSEQNDIVLEMK